MDYEACWHELKERILDNYGICSIGQYCVNPETYKDATTRMQVYNHILSIIEEIENVN